MKITLKFFLILFLCGNAVLSQNETSTPVNAPKTFPNSFILHGSLSNADIAFYTKSIETADFENYRLKEVSVELKFKNGFVLELLSAKELTIKNKNQSINLNAYADKTAQPSYKYPVFEILKSGWIIAEAQTINQSTKK